LVFVGFLGQTWNASGQASLVPGETFSIENYVLRYERSRVERDRAKDMYIADLSVTDRTGAYRGTVSPAKYVYRSHRDQPTSEVDVLPSVRDDLYVVLGSLSLESHRAAIQVYVNPLVSFIWIGVIIVVLGTGICLWPHASMSRQRKTQRPDDGNGERKAALDVERKDAHAS
jgi:cytochrome c-type biogenesis protein CcmF